MEPSIESIEYELQKLNFGDFHPQMKAPLKAAIIEKYMIVLNPSCEDKLIAFDLDDLIWKKITITGETPLIDIGTSISSRGKDTILLFGSVSSIQSEGLPKLYTLTFDLKSTVFTMNNAYFLIDLYASSQVRVFEKSQSLSYQTAQIYENRLLMFGGESRSKYSVDTLSFIPLNDETVDTLQYYENLTEAPKQRVCAHSALYNHTLFISGGYSTFNQSGSSSSWIPDLWSFDLRNLTLTMNSFLIFRSRQA